MAKKAPGTTAKRESVRVPKLNPDNLQAIQEFKATFDLFVRWYDKLPIGQKPNGWSRTLTDYKNKRDENGNPTYPSLTKGIGLMEQAGFTAKHQLKFSINPKAKKLLES